MQPSIPFYNVRNPSVSVPLEALLKINNAEDEVYVPRQIPLLPDSLIYKDPPPSFRDVAFEVFRSGRYSRIRFIYLDRACISFQSTGVPD